MSKAGNLIRMLEISMKDVKELDLKKLSMKELELLKIRLFFIALKKFPSSPDQKKVDVEIDKVWDEINKRKEIVGK